MGYVGYIYLFLTPYLFFKVVNIKTKKCNICERELPISQFNKNKNNKDNLSYYCKDCTKEQKNLYFYEQGNKFYRKIIVEKLKEYPDIKIDGINYSKVINTTITMYDFPGVLNNLLHDLPIFLKKYNLTFEEYEFIVEQCRKNKFWVKAKV